MRPVSRTAVGVARIRAAEARRPDPLFDDPWAQAFVDASPSAAEAARGEATEEVRRRLVEQVSIRTRFYDDVLRGAAAAGLRQVVLVAAGFDTRAFRLGWPAATRLFEVDLPAVLEFKETVLARDDAAATCDRRVVPADLTEDWSPALAAAGHRTGEPTAWLVEGLLVYLDARAVEELLGAVTAMSAPGSRLACERDNSAGIARLRDVAGEHAAVSLWQGGLPDGAAAWLGGHGWQLRAHDLEAVGASYGRRVMPGATGGFLVAERVP